MEEDVYNKRKTTQKENEQRIKLLMKNDTQMTKKHMKTCSISLKTRENKIKITKRYHSTRKKADHFKYWQVCIPTGTLNNCWWKCK